METKAPPEKRFICSFPACDARYNRQWKLDAHLCRHTGVRPFTCGHDGCGKSFPTASHLSRHQLTHSGAKPFVCTADGCTDSFTTNANMLRHVARAHAAPAAADRKSYGCDVAGCGLAFRKNKQLKAHMFEQHAHAQLPPYRCSHEGCPLRFTCISKQRRHEKVHSGYPCGEEACAFTGKTWTEYLRHRKEAHRRAHPCDLCGRVFRDAWFLRQHQRVHADLRVVLRCPREGCQRSFTTEFNLLSHIRSFHEERRPFTCPHDGCGKTFAMKGSLTRHSVAHDPARRKIPKVRKPRQTLSLAARLSGYRPPRSGGKTRDATDVTASGALEPQQTDALGQIDLVLEHTSLLVQSGSAGALQVDAPLQHLTQTTIELGQ